MSAIDDTILVWGAGAIGGTVGAYLARAGHKVHFVDRDRDHVEAMNAGGLRIVGPIEEFAVPAAASTPEAVSGRYGRILLCTKAQDTRAASLQLAPFLAPDGYVASLQNGLNEVEIADVVGPQRTVGAFVNFGADYLSPGVVQFSGRGAVVVGETDGRITPRVRALHALLTEFEPNAIASDNVMGYLWGKLGYGALLFATALTDASICEALDARAPRPLYRRIAGEATAIALALGITPLGFNGYDPAAFAPGAPDTAADAAFDAMVAHNAKSAKTHSGIWRDLAVRKRKTEANAQLGPIVAFGRTVGIDAVATAGVLAMIHEIETGVRPMDWANLAELSARIGAHH
ncbi:ketopantoate reductase family protein [uncultured Alsobacter sp.]|uniref:ketopantoate reductase family protein n=1 Tax=uncultured Alsobacter sp. TaxID=1748258 RepID=UPI0025D17DC4|nr:2-dehydropantoate 2-reductase [uncultured Alsobacter sp.]